MFLAILIPKMLAETNEQRSDLETVQVSTNKCYQEMNSNLSKDMDSDAIYAMV